MPSRISFLDVMAHGDADSRDATVSPGLTALLTGCPACLEGARADQVCRMLGGRDGKARRPVVENRSLLQRPACRCRGGAVILPGGPPAAAIRLPRTRARAGLSHATSGDLRSAPPPAALSRASQISAWALHRIVCPPCFASRRWRGSRRSWGRAPRGLRPALPAPGWVATRRSAPAIILAALGGAWRLVTRTSTIMPF